MEDEKKLEENNEQVKEEITEAPAEEEAKAPAEEVAETPAEEVAETPAEEVAKTPAEEVAKTPVEEVAETPAEEVVETPVEEVVEAPAEEVVEETSRIENKESKSEVQKKIETQIKKKREKEDTKPSRILEYLKTEHKWENYLFIVVALLTLLLGCLILEGTLVVKENFPLAGAAPTIFAIVLVVIGGLGLLYALWPFFKPALPEFKKISWLTMPKFVGNIIRVFVFILILVLLFILYDAFISGIFTKIV